MSSSPAKKTVNLALQGGGSHGAFTWGVLDRLLEDDRIAIEGISGTSAGAMNGAALLEGLAKGGAKGARDALEKFWRGVGNLSGFGAQQGLLNQMLGAWTGVMEQMFSPYQSNPFNYNPLRDLLQKLIDVDTIRRCDKAKLFVCATNVENGRAHIFKREDLTVDVLLASGCLPFTFQAVQIDKAPYWDGGYVGNPALFPLIYNCESPDIIVVQLNPLLRPGTPDTPAEIINRLNEITFNAALIGEMRAIAFVQRLIDEDHLKGAEAARLKRMNMHVIEAEDEMRKYGAASKLDADIDFLLRLKEVGRRAADKWLAQNFDAINDRSSADIRKLYLDQ